MHSQHGLAQEPPRERVEGHVVDAAADPLTTSSVDVDNNVGPLKADDARVLKKKGKKTLFFSQARLVRKKERKNIVPFLFSPSSTPHYDLRCSFLCCRGLRGVLLSPSVLGLGAGRGWRRGKEQVREKKIEIEKKKRTRNTFLSSSFFDARSL